MCRILRRAVFWIACAWVMFGSGLGRLTAQGLSRLDVSENAITRRWADWSGSFEANAKLITIHGAPKPLTITLRLESGVERILEIKNLSMEDRKYIQDIIKAEADKPLLEKAKKQRELWDEFLVAPGRFEIKYGCYEKLNRQGIDDYDHEIVIQKDGLRIYYDLDTFSCRNEQIPQSRVLHETNNYATAMATNNVLKLAGFEIKRHLPAPNLAGKVLRVEENEVLIALGSVHCLRPRSKLIISRRGEPIIDPDTKKNLGNDVRELARVQVTEVHPEFCRAKLLPPRPEEAGNRPAIQAGDLVKFDTINGSVAILMLGAAEDADPDGVAAGKGAPINGRDTAKTNSQLTVSGKAIGEMLTGELVHYKTPVVERTLLQRVVNQLRLQADEKVFDEKQAREFGKQVGASYIVGGTLTERRTGPYPRSNTIVESVNVHLRLIDIETGEIIMAFSGRVYADPS